MVTALSDFFRTTLSKGRDYITVKEEEAHIRSYLKIQQFRYQDILEYSIHIPEELYAYQILKLTLQPLVENALYHGIKNKRGAGPYPGVRLEGGGAPGVPGLGRWKGHGAGTPGQGPPFESRARKRWTEAIPPASGSLTWPSG